MFNCWPITAPEASSSGVVPVGGTSLHLNSDNSYNNETGWSSDPNGAGGASFSSGGGVSQYQAAPSFQTAVQSTGYRTIPDVSLVADPNTGAWIADPYNLSADNPWAIVGGTSLSAPTWAGLIALSNQGRVTAGLATLNSSNPMETQQALYNLPEADFNDITSGSNGGFSAGAGYDLVTGLGTPVANRLVTDLAAYDGSVQSHRAVTVAGGATTSGSNGAGGSFGPANAFKVFAAETISASGVSRGHGALASPVVLAPVQTAPLFTTTASSSPAPTAPTSASIVQAAPRPAQAITPFAGVAFDVAIGTTSAPAASSSAVLNQPTGAASVQSFTGVVITSGPRHADSLNRDGGGSNGQISVADYSDTPNGARIIEDVGAGEEVGSLEADISDPTLLSILAGWDCPDDFATRLSDILGAAGSYGLQFDGTSDLAGQTVMDDKGGAALAGVAGLACFLAGRIDLVRDLRARDVVAAMSFSAKDDEDQLEE
jgi:hypothetical protein